MRFGEPENIAERATGKNLHRNLEGRFHKTSIITRLKHLGVADASLRCHSIRFVRRSAGGNPRTATYTGGAKESHHDLLSERIGNAVPDHALGRVAGRGQRVG